MIEVVVEVGSGAARFSVAVRAESILGAVDIVTAHYPAADVWVLHPIDPESFFVKDLSTPAGLVRIEVPESIAG